MMERCTVIVDARDRFSPTTRCLETLLANTPEPHDLIVVMGGAPEHLRREWVTKFGGRVRFMFKPEFLNQAQARNLALRETRTRFAVVMDNDNFVRPGWLTALVTCQQETGAIMVAPLLLETPRKIHVAGCTAYITHEHGRAWFHKEMRYHGLIYVDGANLGRQRVDYGEFHCYLVEVEPTLRLGGFDEQIREPAEIDAGFRWQQAGRHMWCEPAAVVRYEINAPITADDIRLFAWRWDMGAIWDSYQYMERKWNVDISEHGGFRDFLLMYNSQLGLLPRLFPSRLSLWLDRRIGQARRLVVMALRLPKAILRAYKAKLLGYFTWPASTRHQSRVPFFAWINI